MSLRDKIGLLRWHWEHPGGQIWGNPEKIALGRIEAESMIAALPSRSVAPMRMRIGYGATAKEIALAMGYSADNVRHHLEQGRRELMYG